MTHTMTADTTDRVTSGSEIPDTPDPDATTWVDARPFRALVCQLVSDTGLPWRVLALIAGVSPATVRALVASGTDQRLRRLGIADAWRLYRLDQQLIDGLRKEPAPCDELRPLLWALGLCGCQPHDLARFVGADVPTVRSLMAGGSGWCSRLTLIRAIAACHAWGIDPTALPRRPTARRRPVADGQRAA
ncbi:hypothetical protein GCM10009785_18710 [Brooklawnia cerclae]|uniref:DNA-binding protein n=1 Tax=Brooklawnia cerclae TaxID=349934 RepID=A0ABX0SHX1_9ACTN|nr:hypothetical protein [Brooklawnia cerclae]NIH57556.1 hypothetical protein [Brooklawnia cerclae]